MFKRYDALAAADEAKIAWAKKNKKNPYAKQILKNQRNRTAGGRLINRAMSKMKFGAIGLVLSAISSAVGAAVKFLAQLPAIARNVQDVASRGARFNIPAEDVRKYDKIAEVLFSDQEAGRAVVSGYFGQIHQIIGSTINGNVAQAVGPMAALSSRVGGDFLNAAIGYYIPNKTHTISQVAEAGINDVFLGSFQQITGEGTESSISKAFSVNLNHLRASLGEQGLQLANEAMRAYEAMPTRQEEIRNYVVGRKGTILDWFSEHGVTFPGGNVASNVDNQRAGQVNQQMNQLLADARGVRDGILIKILGKMEPMVAFLRQLLRGVLLILNHGLFFNGQFTDAIADLDRETGLENSIKRSVNETLLYQVGIELATAKREWGFSDEAWQDFMTNMNRGQLRIIQHNGKTLSWDEAQRLASIQDSFDNLTRVQQQFSNPRVQRGERMATGVGGEANASYVESVSARRDLVRKGAMEAALRSPMAQDPIRLQSGIEQTQLMLTIARDFGGNLQDATRNIAFSHALHNRLKGERGLENWGKYFAERTNDSGIPEFLIENPITGHIYENVRDFIVGTQASLDEMRLLQGQAAGWAYGGNGARDTIRSQNMPTYGSSVRIGNERAFINALDEEIPQIVTAARQRTISEYSHSLVGAQMLFRLSADGESYTIYFKDATGKNVAEPHIIQFNTQQESQRRHLRDSPDFSLPLENYFDTEGRQ